MPVTYSNNAATLLASSITDSATTILLTPGTGALFPTLPTNWFFYGTIENTAGTVIEVVKVTARSVDALTVLRGQDGTAAQAFAAGDKFELRTTRALFNEFGQLSGDNNWTGTNSFVSLTLDSLNLTSPLSVPNGGTGRSSLASGSLLLGNGTGAVNLLAPGAPGQVLTVVGGAAAWASPALGSTVQVSQGGTGRTSVTANALVTGGSTGTSSLQTIIPGASGFVLASNGTSWYAADPSVLGGGGGGGAGSLIGLQVFTASGTYTPTSGAAYAEVTVVGGGAVYNEFSSFSLRKKGYGGMAIGRVAVSAPVSVTVGAAGASSVFGSISATAGNQPSSSLATNGAGSGGAINTHGPFGQYGWPGDGTDAPTGGVIVVREFS